MKDQIKVPDGFFLPLPLVDNELPDPDENAAQECKIQQILAQPSRYSGGWEELGLKEPFISCKTVGRKVVVFDVTTNLCPGVVQSFNITFNPGFPARICLLDLPPAEKGPQLTVQNGSQLPPLTVACFDAFNNRTDPEQVGACLYIYFVCLVDNFVSCVFLL